jgi:hypothetical protein
VTSNVFSFGLVLYEALSGRQAFARGSSVETMAAIVRDEPEPLYVAPALQNAVSSRGPSPGRGRALRPDPRPGPVCRWLLRSSLRGLGA